MSLPLPKNVPQCQHTKLSGVRCGSPAMKGRRYCYFHRQLRLQQHRCSSKYARQRPLVLPMLEDAASIQFALMEVTQAVLDDRISEKKAGLLLYALQTAALNLKQMNTEPQEELIRQQYPESVAEMERIRRRAETGERQEGDPDPEWSLMAYLFTPQDWKPGDPPPWRNPGEAEPGTEGPPILPDGWRWDPDEGVHHV